MENIYAFWNNKGGTGKTSLLFQTVTIYAEHNPTKRILVVDVCPQANASELLLGGLIGDGSENLRKLHEQSPRKSIGGYFESRLPSPFQPMEIIKNNFICKPHDYNDSIPANIDLLAGDGLLELQGNAIATLANTQIPNKNTWIAVTDWLRDFLKVVENEYEIVFIDTNPSFSMYTQIALSASNALIIPVMADDSSRRAVQNVLMLVHGINIPSKLYTNYSFPEKIKAENRKPPKIHLLVHNRLTQYMGPASAYNSVLSSINNMIEDIFEQHKDIFTSNKSDDLFVNVKDFQTTGVVAFAEGKPFTKLNSGSHTIQGKETQIQKAYLDKCINAVEQIVSRL